MQKLVLPAEDAPCTRIRPAPVFDMQNSLCHILGKEFQNTDHAHSSAGECMRIELTVKGRPASPDVAPNTLLVEAPRHRPQRGVGIVLPAGRAAKPCHLPEGWGDGHAVTAIEGLKAPPRPVPAASGGCHIPAIPAS
jgi:hypothetical protein